LKINSIYFIVAALFVMGCGGVALAAPPATPPPVIAPTWTFSPLPSPSATATLIPTLPPTDTFTASPSPTITPTETFTPSPEPQWVIQGPGQILAPILLYHQIGYSKIKDNPYYVSPEEFEKQMNLLYAWGYRTITVRQLAIAIHNGAELPVKPIVLTFDDGNENVYTTAFPIMQKYGFVGTAYLVYNYVGAANFLNKDEIQELYNSGWEIGSHSISHMDLTKHPNREEDEIYESRRKLENLLGIPISTFAYPFGTYNDLTLFYMNNAGYIAAVGLGPDMHQGLGNIFYLYRRDIKGSYDLKTFAGFLPWQGDLNNLSVVTVVP